MIVRGPRPERYVVLDNDIVRNHANYTESQQWRDWAHRLDTILPEIRRHQ